jgi:hypothetical protein
MPIDEEKDVTGVRGRASWPSSASFWSITLAALATAVAVATFFGLQVEKHKSLELAYRAKLSFFNADVHATPKVSVLYDGRPISQLTKISVLVSNSGSIPIEKRDIERDSLLHFDPAKARIIEVHLTQESPVGLGAAVTSEGNAVHISHGLLNPGDSFAFEILLDGDPGNDLPPLDSRITGVEPITKRPGDAQPRNLLLSRGRPTILIAVIITTVLILVLDFFTVAACYFSIDLLFEVPKASEVAESLKKLEKELDPDNIATYIYYLLPANLQRAAGSPQPSWFDREENIPLRDAKGTGQETAREIRRALRAGLKERVVSEAKWASPALYSDYLQKLIAEMQFDAEGDQSATAFTSSVLSRAKIVLRTPLPAKARWARAGGAMIAAATLLLSAPFATLTGIALWQLFFLGK